MKLVILNGSPRRNGIVAHMLQAVVDGLADGYQVEWVDVYDLTMRPCVGCMKCRPDGECCLPRDDAHRVGQSIQKADGLMVGTPTYWGNMSAPLKMLFDRIVPAFMGERVSGLPLPRHKGKPAVIVTACTTPWPFHFLLGESRGAVRAIRKVLRCAGYRIAGVLVQPGTRQSPVLSRRVARKARKLARTL